MPSIAEQNSAARIASSYRPEFGDSRLRYPSESVIIIAISGVQLTHIQDYVLPPFMREPQTKLGLGVSWRLCTTFPKSSFA